MKTVLVTGSTSGIGRATALLFAKHGYSVIVTGRDQARGESVATETGGTFIKADITNHEDVKNLFSKIKTLDVLVNNAGGVVGNDSLKKATTVDLNASLQVNFYGAFYCSQEVIKTMKKGSIVNVASICGFTPTPGGQSEFIPVYSAAKAALINFSANLAKLLAPNIRVNCVLPGYTKTKEWGIYMTALAKVKNLAGGTLIKRFITPIEVAEAIYSLATNEAISGTQLVVDGGSLQT